MRLLDPQRHQWIDLAGTTRRQPCRPGGHGKQQYCHYRDGDDVESGHTIEHRLDGAGRGPTTILLTERLEAPSARRTPISLVRNDVVKLTTP